MTDPAVPTWVVGAGGLLGRHVVASLRRRGQPVLTARVPWTDPGEARTALTAGIRTLADAARGGGWNIAWCAGAGVVATPEAALRAEADLFEVFLADVESSSLAQPDGAVFLASSAGGVYAGSPAAAPFTEASPTGALVPYGHAKLRMESALRAHVERTGSAALIARIANLYGPGQDLTKQQGLISQLCRTALTGQPLTVYVPLDTMRDYVFAEDCADLVVAGLLGVRRQVDAGDSRVVTKVVASGQSVTIGALVAETARQYKRRPHVVVKAPVEGTGQVVDLRLRSTVWTELDAALRTTTAVGFLRTATDVGEQLRSPGRGLARHT